MKAAAHTNVWANNIVVIDADGTERHSKRNEMLHCALCYKQFRFCIIVVVVIIIIIIMAIQPFVDLGRFFQFLDPINSR
jgi:hypothetical protein